MTPKGDGVNVSLTAYLGTRWPGRPVAGELWERTGRLEAGRLACWRELGIAAEAPAQAGDLIGEALGKTVRKKKKTRKKWAWGSHGAVQCSAVAGERWQWTIRRCLALWHHRLRGCFSAVCRGAEKAWLLRRNVGLAANGSGGRCREVKKKIKKRSVIAFFLPLRWKLSPSFFIPTAFLARSLAFAVDVWMMVQKETLGCRLVNSQTSQASPLLASMEKSLEERTGRDWGCAWSWCALVVDGSWVLAMISSMIDRPLQFNALLRTWPCHGSTLLLTVPIFFCLLCDEETQGWKEKKTQKQTKPTISQEPFQISQIHNVQKMWMGWLLPSVVKSGLQEKRCLLGPPPPPSPTKDSGDDATTVTPSKTVKTVTPWQFHRFSLGSSPSNWLKAEAKPSL